MNGVAGVADVAVAAAGDDDTAAVGHADVWYDVDFFDVDVDVAVDVAVAVAAAAVAAAAAGADAGAAAGAGAAVAADAVADGPAVALAVDVVADYAAADASAAVASLGSDVAQVCFCFLRTAPVECDFYHSPAPER